MHAPGTFCTALLHTGDLAGAARFYQALFGWDAQEDEAGVSLRLDGKRVAGIVQVESANNHWLPCVGVDDVVATAAAAERAGGAVLETVMRGTGDRRLSVLKDPEGAVFGLCSPGDPHAFEVTNVPGAVWWIEALAKAPEVMQRFYGGLFGWHYRANALPPHPQYITSFLGDTQTGGILPIDPTWPEEPHWQVLFEVEQLERSAERVVRAGGELGFGPLEIPSVGRLGMVEDARGGRFVLMQPHRKTAPR